MYYKGENALYRSGLSITKAGYKAMCNKQKGLCAICGKAETRSNQHGPRGLCVDHNHETNKVRGLLCARCNTKLGYLEDIEFVIKAKLYLEKHT